MFSFGGGTSKKSSSATNEDVALVHALLVMGLQDAVRRIIQASLSARERRIRGEYARGEEELVDSMTEVEALLEVLELCLWHGLREPQRRSHGRSHGRHDKTQAGVGTSSTAESSHFWDFVLLLERVDPTAFGGTIMLVRANSGCSTNQGLCRAWIRMLLNQNALEYTIRALCRLATTSGRDFYEDWAFLRWSAETNRTMFFTLLGVLNNVGFALNTKNRGLDRPSPVGPGDMLSHDALKCCLAFESALAAACAANPNDPPTVLVASSVDSEVTGRFVYLQPGLFSNRNTGYQLRVVDAKRGTSPRQWGLFAPAQDQPRYLANAKSVSDPPLQDWAPSDEVAAEFNKPPQAVKMLHSQSVRARLYPGSHKIKWGTLLRSEIQAIRVEIKQVEHLRKRLDAVRKIECPMGEDEEDLPLVQPLETVVEEISQSDSPPDSDSGAHVRATETTPNESPMVDPLASGVDRENFAPHADAQDQTEDESKLTSQARHKDLEVHSKENIKASLAANEAASFTGQDDHAEQSPEVAGDGLSLVERDDAQQDEHNRDIFTATEQFQTESQDEAPRDRPDADIDAIEVAESAQELDIGLTSESERIIAERNRDAHEAERSAFDSQNGAEKESVSDEANAKQEEKHKVVNSKKDGNEDERDEPIIGTADQSDPPVLSSDAAQNEELLDIDKTTKEGLTHATPSMDHSDLGGSTGVARPARCVSDEIEVGHSAAYGDTDASVEKDGINENSHKTELSDDDMSIVQDAEILSNTSKEETVSSGNAAPDAVKSMKKDAVSESETLLAENQDSVALVEKDGANEDSQKADSSDDMSIVQDAEILSNTSKEETVSSLNAAPDDVKSMKKDADSESGSLLAEKQDSVASIEKDGTNENSHKTGLSDDMSIVQDAEILSNTSKEETVSSGNAAPDDVKSTQKDADSESGTSLAEKRVSDVPRMKKSLNPFEDESVDSSGEDESEIAESDAIESSNTDRVTAQDTETLSNKINDDVAMSTRAAFDDRDDANSKAKVSEAGVTNESKSEGDAIDNSIEDTGDALDLHVAEGHHAGATIKSLDTIKTNDRYQQESLSEVSSNHEASTAEVSSSQSSEADSLSIDADLSSEVEAAKHSKSKGKGRKGPRRVQMASIEDTDLAQDPLQALEPAPSSRGSRRISRPTVVHASKIAEAGELAKSSSAIQFNSALLSAANNFVVMQDDDEDDDVESVEIHGHTSCDEDSLETGAAGEVDRETDGSRARDLSAPTAPSGESEEERLARYAREEEESLAAFIAEQNTEKANSVSSKRELASHASKKDEPPANVSIVPTSEFIDLVRAYVRLDPQKAAARTLASKIHGSTGYEIGPMLSPSQDMDPDADEVTKANSEAPVAASSKFSLAVFSGRLSLWGSGTDAEQENDSGSRSGANAASSALETGAENRETSDLAHETDSEIDIDLASDANVTRVESASVVGQYISKRASDMHVRYIIRVQLRKIARAGNDDLEEWISSENDASILQERTEVDTEEASSHVAARTATYTVHRRFRDFKQLRAALFNAAAASSDQDSKDTFPTLPKTAWTRSFSEDYIARKRIGLDDFLQEILRLRLEGASAREHPVLIDFLTQGMCVPWEEDEEERGPDFPLDSPSLNRRGSGLRRKGSRGLHVALITDPRGDPQVMEERDSIGLAEQDFRCISCGRDISIALGESKGLWGASREPSRRSARFCHYTEGWFCPWCFSCGSAGGREQEREFEYYNESDTGLDWDEASSTSRLAPLQEHNRVLPTRVLHHWDFEPLAVSADAASFLDSISQHPVLCVSAESPRLFSQVKELQHARLLRLQLVFARETLARCVENENSLEGVAPALRSREHLAQETEMYSMNDLFELHLGTLIPLLMRAVDQVSDHITKSCEHCRSTAQTCAVCNKKDDPLFAFDIDKVVLCRGCQGAFHRECFVSIGGEEFCPICKKSALNS